METTSGLSIVALVTALAAAPAVTGDAASAVNDNADVPLIDGQDAAFDDARSTNVARAASLQNMLGNNSAATAA